MRTDRLSGEIKKYWKSIWEKEASHNTNAQFLENPGTRPYKKQRERVTRMKS